MSMFVADMLKNLLYDHVYAHACKKMVMAFGTINYKNKCVIQLASDWLIRKATRSFVNMFVL